MKKTNIKRDLKINKQNINYQKIIKKNFFSNFLHIKFFSFNYFLFIYFLGNFYFPPYFKIKLISLFEKAPSVAKKILAVRSAFKSIQQTALPAILKREI